VGFDARRLRAFGLLHAALPIDRVVLGLMLRRRLRLHLLLLEGQDGLVDLFSRRRGPEDLQRVLLQHLDPGTDIGRVLRWIVPDAEHIAHD
jgi:hypothetical protein